MNRQKLPHISAGFIFIAAAMVFASSNDQYAGVFSPLYKAAQCKDYPKASESCAPARNDVSIRTVYFRAEADVFTAMNDFYATRLDWVYFNNSDGSDQDNIAKV